jgi:two-component system nitrate/nitrite response regulator NarL
MAFARIESPPAGWLMMSLSTSVGNAKLSKAIRVLVADRTRMGSQLLAESLARDRRFEIVAVTAPANLLSIAAAGTTEVAVISVADTESDRRTGLQLARTLDALRPRIKTVVMVDANTRELIIGSFRCGARAVYCRAEPLSTLFTCIERVHLGELCVNTNQAEFLLDALRSTPTYEGIDDSKINLLAKRELEVAERAAQGLGNKQIADQLGLSEHTVKNYLFRIFEKLGVSNRFELLFLLYKERDRTLPNQTTRLHSVDLETDIESCLKAAEKGFVGAQFIVGLAYRDGIAVQKDSRSAYYWVRIAEENSREIGQRTRALAQELIAEMPPDDVAGLERNIASTAPNKMLVGSKTLADLFKRAAA